MHEYMTRHMVALKPFIYAGSPLEPGDPFMATPDDATYFTRHGRAKDAQPAHGAPAVAVQAPAAAPVVVAAAPQAPAAWTEPPITTFGQAVDEAVALVAPTPQVEPATEDVPPPDAGDAAAPRSRRGRPTNAERLARLATEAGVDSPAAAES